MRFLILKAGLQTTLQAGPRYGLRHKGVPSGGAADPLSLALANRAAGNAPDATGLEITLSGASILFEQDTAIGLTGGSATHHLNGAPVASHETIRVKSGDTLELGPVNSGCRTYLCVAGGLVGEPWLGSSSTYLPAALGGHEGRALRQRDRIEIRPAPSPPFARTPADLRPHISRSWALRAVPGPEAETLSARSQADLFNTPYTVTQRLDRMGAALAGQPLELESDGRLPSSAVFPGTVQCPPGGAPFLLMAEAQTTGGYPRIAQVIRADRHMLGQLRPGDRLQLLRTTPEKAANVLREKTALLQNWLGNAFKLG